MRDAKINILFLTNNMQPAGAESFMYNHVKHLNRDLFNPTVCQIKEGGELVQKYKEIGVEVCSLGEKRRLALRTIKGLIKVLKRERIHIVQAHVLYSCVLARIVGRLASVPVIVATEQDVNKGTNATRPHIRWINQVTMPFADATVYISPAVKQSFSKTLATVKLFWNRLEELIPNGIDIERTVNESKVSRAEILKSVAIEEKEYVIGTVGRLHPQKGQTYLLEAFGEFQRSVPFSSLIIIGWGALEEDLKQRAEALGISKKVKFLGKRTDVYKLLSCMDSFVFPSLWEGQGIAVLEAMAIGVPVIASKVDGIQEMVRHEETGLLVPPGNPRAIREAMTRLFSDKTLSSSMIKNAKLLVREKFSIESSAREYEKLYLKLIKKKRLQLKSWKTAETI